MKRIYINPSFELNGIYDEDTVGVSVNPPQRDDTTPEAGL